MVQRVNSSTETSGNAGREILAREHPPADSLLEEFSTILEKIATKIRNDRAGGTELPVGDLEPTKRHDRPSSKRRDNHKAADGPAAESGVASDTKLRKEHHPISKEDPKENHHAGERGASSEKPEQPDAAAQRESVPAETEENVSSGEREVELSEEEVQSSSVECAGDHIVPSEEQPEAALQNIAVQAAAEAQTMDPAAEVVAEEAMPQEVEQIAVVSDDAAGEPGVPAEQQFAGVDSTAAAAAEESAVPVDGAPQTAAADDSGAALSEQQAASAEQQPVSAGGEQELLLRHFERQIQQKLAKAGQQLEQLGAPITQPAWNSPLTRDGVVAPLQLRAAISQSVAAVVGIDLPATAVKFLSNGAGSGEFFKGGSASSQRGEVARSVALSRANVAQTMERVESALKEVARSKDGKTVSVRLDPPTLGSVKIDVTYREGQLHARVVAEVPQVQQLLREKAHELQSLLRKAGIDAREITVTVVATAENSSESGLSFGGGRGGAEQQGSGAPGNNGDGLGSFRRGDGRGDGSAAGSARTGVARAGAETDHWIA